MDKLLRDLRRDEQLAAAFRDNIETVFASYQLDAVERELLQKWDVRAMYDRGVNPLLLLLANGRAGQSMRAYGEAMNPESRRGGD